MSIEAQKLYIGANHLFLTDYPFKGIELETVMQHPSKIIYRTNFGYAYVPMGYNDFSSEGGFVGISISRRIGGRRHPKFSFLLGGQNILNRQREVYKFDFGRNEFNSIWVKEDHYWMATGVHIGISFYQGHRVAIELLNMFNILLKDREDALNKYCFGIGTDGGPDPYYNSGVRLRMQLNVRVKVFDTETKK